MVRPASACPVALVRLRAFILILGLLAAPAARAQTTYMPGTAPPTMAPPDSVIRVEVHRLAPGVFAAKVRYVWTGWVELPEGLLLVDTSLNDTTAAILADSIRVYSGDKPVKYVVNTHAHSDHIGGDFYFASRGATIIAQASAAARIDSVMKARASLDRSAKRIKPAVRVDRKKILGPAERKIEILWLGKPAHTAGDMIVYLPKQKILFAGDLISNRAVPWMLDPDMNRKGWIASIDSLWTKAFVYETLVPGHGILAKPVDEYRFTARYLSDAYAKAEKEASWGTSLNAVKDWGFLGSYEDAEFYAEVHFMNMRRLYNEARGIKTPGRQQPGAYRK
jgi:cyclase